jgi:hypothetical protein
MGRSCTWRTVDTQTGWRASQGEVSRAGPRASRQFSIRRTLGPLLSLIELGYPASGTFGAGAPLD